MMRPAMVLVGLLLLVTPVAAQLQTGGNSAFVYEQYSFDSGLAYSDVSELTVPLTFSTYLSNRTHLTLSGGLTRVSLTGDPDVGLDDKEIAGIIDTEARLVVDLIPDRLSFLATGVVPTGIEALEVQEEAILAALSSPVIGFSTTRLGGGGRVGVDSLERFPLGRWPWAWPAPTPIPSDIVPSWAMTWSGSPALRSDFGQGWRGPWVPRATFGWPPSSPPDRPTNWTGMEQGEVGTRSTSMQP